MEYARFAWTCEQGKLVRKTHDFAEEISGFAIRFGRHTGN